MMDRRNVRNMWSFTTKQICEISASSWFYYKEICYDARSYERKIHRGIRPDTIVVFWFCRGTSQNHPKVTIEPGDPNINVSGMYLGGSCFEPRLVHRLILWFSVVFLKFRKLPAEVYHNSFVQNPLQFTLLIILPFNLINHLATRSY